MSAIVPKAAETDTLTQMIANILNTCKMHLFSGNITPDANTTLATLAAAEATFTGYASETLSTWTTPSIDGTNAAVSTSSQGVFTPTAAGGSGNLYGYYLTDSASGKLYLCERFAGAPLSEPQNVSLEVDVTYSVITRF